MMKKKTIIIGSSGKIGSFFFLKRKKNQILTYYKNKFPGGIKFDLNSDNIYPLIKKYKIDKAVILSAYSDPDFCKKNKRISNKLNIIKTKKLIEALVWHKIYFIFFSSEQVFDGKKGNYKEEDLPNPISLYGKQKYIIENFIKKMTQNYCIFRIAKTYDNNVHDNTLISDFLKKSKDKSLVYAAKDQKFSPLYVFDLVKITNFFLKKKIIGTYNIGGNEKISRYNLYKTFNNLLKNNKQYSRVKLFKINLKYLKFFENRPLNLTFNIKRLLKIINFELTDIKQIFLKTVK